jgi:hypothetical protein
LFKLLETYIISFYIIQKGCNSIPSVSPNCGWIIDSGETGHMIGESTLFFSYISCAGNKKNKSIKWLFWAIAGKDYVVLSPMLTLKYGILFPNLSCSLVSVSKLAEDKNCQTSFFSFSLYLLWSELEKDDWQC